MEDAVANDIGLRSKGLLVFNADDDMVVSGSYFFAFSLGVPIYCVSTPFINWLIGERKFPGIYSFSSMKKLLESIGGGEGRNEPDLNKIRVEFGDDVVLDKLSAIFASDE